MLTERQKTILEYLEKADQIIDITTLRQVLGKSERTVRYDISTLRKHLETYQVDLAYTPERGFYIPINHKVMFDLAISELKGDMKLQAPQTFKEDIYNDLLFILSTRASLSLESLSDLMYLSSRTLLEYINGFNENFQGSIRIENQRNLGYAIQGQEYDLCYELARRIQPLIARASTELEIHKRLPKLIKDSISLDEVKNLVKRYKQSNSKYQLWLNTDTYSMILSFLIITKIRIHKGFKLEGSEDISFVIDIQEDTLDYVYNILESHHYTKEHITRYRLMSVAKILLNNDVFIQKKHNADPEISQVLKSIANYLESDEITSNYTFDVEGLRADLELHFQNFLTRNYVKTTDEEIKILDEIEYDYPDYYQLAIRCGEIFKEHFSVNLSKKELSYIAIYLVKHVVSGLRQKRVIVVCATGRGLSTLLVTRIRHVFPTLNIVETMSFFQLESIKRHDNIDLVISTIPVEKSIYPVVKISNVLSNADIRTIHEYLNEDITVDYSREANLMNYFNDFELDGASGQSMQSYSTIISEIILSLIRFTTDISDRYPMPVDSILGLTIHLVMAIPRWYEPISLLDHDNDAYLMELEKEHPELIRTMNVFFKNIENSLQIAISDYERIAFYQYMIKGDHHA